MIDFHTHILPALDDGSGSVGESIRMLRMLKEQGVERAYATPHFDPMKDSPKNFFAKRERSFGALSGELTHELPELRLGAEIAYYPGISRMRELLDMRLEGTDLLLVELPEARMSSGELRELCDLAAYGDGVRLVIAHVERYLDFFGGVPEDLIAQGALMQANASFFTRQKTRALAIKLLSEGKIHLLGSDCHGERYRPPNLGEAYEIIKKRLGEEKLTKLLDFARSVTE